MQRKIRNTFISLKQNLFDFYCLDIYTQLHLIVFSYSNLHSFSIKIGRFLYGHFDSMANTTFTYCGRYFISINSNNEPWNKEFKHYIIRIIPLIQKNILYLLWKLSNIENVSLFEMPSMYLRLWSSLPYIK